MRRLLRARRYADAGPREVASALGMPEWRAKKMITQIRAYKEEELIDALQLLAVADLDMKGEFPSPDAALERTVMKIVTGTR
jgi:DNA polymerase-3 subunit delta